MAMLVHKELYPDEIDDLDGKVQSIIDTIEEYKGSEAESVLHNDNWMMTVTQIESKDEFLIAKHIAEKKLSAKND